MSKSSEAVKRWRANTKNRMVVAMGGKCQICGYSRCNDALDFHHIDPSTKEISLGAVRGSPVSWHKIVAELRKCIMICANCHREIHTGMTDIPDEFSTFNEEYANYRILNGVKDMK